MNNVKIEKLWKQILKEIGENPDREGLKETPKRIANMYEEIFRGYNKEQLPNVTVFNNGADGLVYDQMIIDTGDFYSQCEHHLVPFFGQYYFAYIPSPNGKVLGISKIARVVNYFSAKLQIQERLVTDVVEYLWKKLSVGGIEPIGMAIIMKGEHLCKTMRGVKKKGQMITSIMKGEFRKNDVKNEFLSLVGNLK